MPCGAMAQPTKQVLQEQIVGGVERSEGLQFSDMGPGG